MTLKAIETIYRGYRFRSRLEARWAVFMDTLKVPWQYEAEGFDLDGLLYLPDFWLPKHKCFLEIKPAWPDETNRSKMRRLAVASGYEVVLLHHPEFAPPDWNPVGGQFTGAWGGLFKPDYPIDDLSTDGMVHWEMCPQCWMDVAHDGREQLWPTVYYGITRTSWYEQHVKNHYGEALDRHPRYANFHSEGKWLDKAFLAARTARFWR